ncbi:MAG: hypothetical protein JWQ40_5103 [Segetibacter sp.]|nr:hypothetical protein [Segetibacter sp.]
MFYLKKVNDIFLLEAELKKLKILYAELLKKPAASSSLNEVRRMIKVLSARINVLKMENVIHS